MKRAHQFMAVVAMGLLLAWPARSRLQAAGDDLAVTQPGQSVLIDVLGNDGSLGGELRLLKAFKPAHGTASIENGRIRYTPAPGFQGSDSFRYMAQSADSQPGQATVNVEVGQGGVRLRLAGRVVDEPIAYATVKVSIGGFDFIAHADAQGNYVLDIAALQGDAFVTLEATGVSPSGEPVRFYSAVGEIVRLAGAAGGDGILTRDEFNQVNVTNLSTAQYVLLAEANGGTPVTSDQELLPLTQNIDIDRLLELAAVIKLVVDEGVPLPAGVSDPLALISDADALADFKASLAPDQLAQAVDAVSQDPNLTPVYAVGRVPTGYSLVFAGAPGTIRAGISHPGLLTLANAGGSGGAAMLVDLNVATDDAWTWALDGGDLLLSKVVAEPVTYFEILPSCSAQNMEVTETLQTIRLHRLQDGAGVDYIEASVESARTYVDLDPNDACPVPPDGASLQVFTVLGFEDRAGELPFASNEAFGQFALATYAPNVGLFGGAAVFDFDTHSVSHPDLGPAFSAAVVDGRLEMDVVDAATGQTVHQQYRRLQLDGAKGEGLMLLITRPDGRQTANYGVAARIDASGVLAAGTMAGQWRSGFDISRFVGDGTIGNGFYLVTNADGTGNQRTIDTQGNVFNSFPFAWSVESGNFLARSYRAPPFGVKSSCVGFDPCFLTRVRSWQPLARSGNRVYVLEELSDRPNLAATLRLGSQRINFYEQQ